MQKIFKKLSSELIQLFFRTKHGKLIKKFLKKLPLYRFKSLNQLNAFTKYSEKQAQIK